MSLIGTLNVAKSALAVQQAAIQVVGNNIANAGNPEYTRQVADIQPNSPQQLRPGVFVGTGINLESIKRQIDEALETRIRGSVSANLGAETTQQWISRIEAIFNELSDEDLSTQLSNFFNSWSNLANKPQDIALRQVVLQSAGSVANWMNNIQGDLITLRGDIDQRTEGLIEQANQLAQNVADLNKEIVIAEGAAGNANGLRDQRDAVLKQLSELIDIKTVADRGAINVYVGSEPLVLYTENRGVGLRSETVDGQLVNTVIFKANNGEMSLTDGQLGALSKVRNENLTGVLDQIDTLAANLIFEVNKLHASGQGLEGFSQVTGIESLDDTTVALNHEDAGLDFAPINGSFVVHVRQKATGLVSSTLVQVDLDGLYANDTTLASLVADIDGIADISASIQSGKLHVQADSANVDISFSQDSSGVLAALGVNTFFTGSDANTIAVNAMVKNQPTLLAAAKNGQTGDNQTARAIAALESAALSALNGGTMKENYQGIINTLAVDSAGARNDAEASQVVRETLEAQREAISGVSLDEEAINLMRYQRAFQAASRVVAAIDELMKTVLSLV